MKYILLLVLIVGVVGEEEENYGFQPIIPDLSAVPSELLKSGSGVEATATCYQPGWHTCQNTYFAEMGLVGPFPSAQAFMNAIQGIYARNGQNGFIRVCNAQRYLYTCLGAAQYPICTSALHFLRQGVNPGDAFAYQSFYRQEHFQCGGGYMTFLYNWPCITQTNIFMNSTLQGCMQHYSKNIPIHTDQACALDMTLANCYQTVFKKCSTNVGWTMCEAVRVALDSTFPQCNNRCQVASSLSDESQDQPEETAAAEPAKEEEA